MTVKEEALDDCSLEYFRRKCYYYAMKEHISITIDRETVARLRRYARRERRPVSTVVEIAVEMLLDQNAPASEQIVTTRGSYQGSFSREDTYEGR